MTRFFRKLRWLMRRPDKEAELQEELQFHVEEEAGERQAQGLTGEEARRAARRELGNVALVQEDTRAAWTWTFWEQLVQDVRYGLRTIAANKTFSAMAILSLALGIGANTAIFSFMDSILLRSLPVPDPQSLVMLGWQSQHRNEWATAIDAALSPGKPTPARTRREPLLAGAVCRSRVDSGSGGIQRVRVRRRPRAGLLRT